MEKGSRTPTTTAVFLAFATALSAPAMGQTSTGQGAATVPPVVITTKKASPPKKAVAVKKTKAPKQASAPKQAAPPETADVQEAPPPGSSEVSQGDLASRPIDTTSYFVGLSKSALSSNQAANPASVTVIRYSEETTRPVRSYVELLKPITGVASNDFDQGGVGFGFTLRGFSERSNGAQVALYIDGVPVNQASHRSANGNGDLSSLIPELVDTFELTRGPFDVRAGPFALAGSAHYTTADNPTSGVIAKGGSFEYARGVGVYSFGVGEVRGYGSLVASTQEGYRDNTGWEQYNTFNKFLFPMLDGTGSVRFQLYDSDFESPGFIRRDLIQNGTISEKDARNPSDGGDTELQNLVFNYKQDGEQPFTAVAYAIHSDHNRYSSRQGNPIPQPANTPNIQFLTQDDRVTYGATIDKYFRSDLPLGMGIDLLVGTGVQADDVETNQFATTARQVVSVTSPDGRVDFTLTNPFAYVQSNLKPFSWLKLTGGLRYDQLYFDIENLTNPAATTSVSPSISVLQPKAGITVTPVAGLDFFANYGEGFRPPSAIGNQLLRDPSIEESTLATKEVGVQFNSADRVWHFLASTYYTTFTNEIQGQGAPLFPISLGPSIREGYDIEARVRAYRAGRTELSIYGNYSHVDGKLTDATVGTVIPDIADFFVKYGFDLTVPLGGDYSPHLLTLSAGQVWEGPKYLDARKIFGRTETFSRIDASLTYTNEDWKGFSVFVDGIFYPDNRLDETAFIFANQIAVSAKAPVSVVGGVFIPF